MVDSARCIYGSRGSARSTGLELRPRSAKKETRIYGVMDVNISSDVHLGIQLTVKAYGWKAENQSCEVRKFY